MKWIEVKYTLPRKEAREAAQKYFRRYPIEGYETHISHWHITPDGKIFFIMRRTPTCD